MTQTTPPRTVFLTGATGLLGSYLLKILLENNHKVYALARSKNNQPANRRIINSLLFWDKTLSEKIQHLKIIEGDISQECLGINEKDRKILSDEVDTIYHSAAITELNIPLEEISKVNTDGTRNVLELALNWQKNGPLKKVNHISTAYVYGDYTDSFTEDDLLKGQKFNTNYEKTKFEAERLVHQYREKNLLIDIFRPPLIAGESKKGMTFQLLHIYQFLDLCKKELFDSLPLADGCLSIVPVDHTARAIYLLDRTNVIKNATYHPFPREMCPIEEIIARGAEILKFKPPKLTAFGEINSLKLTPVQILLLKNAALAINFKGKLHSDKTNDILAKLGYTLPAVGKEALSIIIGYLKTKSATWTS